MKEDIEACQNKTKRAKLRKDRNSTMTRLHNKVKKSEERKTLKQVEEIEKAKNDTKMFKAIKLVNRNKPKQPLLIQGEGGLKANEEQQTTIIAEYFKTQFHKNAEPLPEIKPSKMREPFTSEEIKEAIKSLKNNRSAGVDDIKAELLKYGPDEINNEIATILNETARTGQKVQELTKGILKPLQKPNKEKGPPKNLRPIILLSMIRKILAICLIKRINKRIDNQIPLSQAAYREGRSTTEHAFATKLLAERATTSKNETIYILLMDMSKAFDNIDRRKLIEDLSQVLEKDELHLIKIMLEVEISVKCGNAQSDFFPTDTGAPQGDCLSAIEFTFYLAETLKRNEKIAKEDHTYCTKEEQPRSMIYTEHSYTKVKKEHIEINQEYADDISQITTNKNTIQKIKNELPKTLNERNLKCNEDKTEEYEIKRNGNEDWKKCKMLGSLLDTQEDIKRRKGLAINALRIMKHTFASKKLSLKTKSRIFDAYISSIFLYNSEIWTVTKTDEQAIDAFQRRIIRSNVLNIKWPKTISNEQIKRKTNIKPWSKTIRTRRLRWFGHLIRLHEDTPARKALEQALKLTKLPQGRPKTTWLQNMKKQLKEELNMSWQEACNTAKDRDIWRLLVKGIAV